MAEAHNSTRLLNPWVFHLQKLGLELKCPFCLNLLNKPMLLPCNHIFCNQCIPKPCQFRTDCPACQQHCTNEEIRPASYMENIVSIYRSLDATFNSTILPLLSNDSGSPISISASIDRLRKKPRETEPKLKNISNDTVLINRDASGIAYTKCCTSEELDFVNNGPEVSPGSSPSFGTAKKADDNDNDNDQSCRDVSTEYHRIKRSGGDKLGFSAYVVDIKENSDSREHKRQKKLNYGVTDAVLLSHGYSQQIVSNSNQVAVSNYEEECKFEEDKLLVSSTALCDASNVNGRICSFCHSSKITEGTGPMLHYADGEEVASDERAFSRAIPVHSKCIEWSPQVYFDGEKIMNLESELARSSKLKCSSCGLKGAALGCFAKSCRRTYHVPCALKVPDCRWNCDDFVMLCPMHRSIKFPSEKSCSRKRYGGEKSSLSNQLPSELLNFWTSSPNGPQEWVFCASALSSEDKLLMVKFAGKCGATVFKSWNPNVTHVIAATDLNGACSRTLKVLMAILNGKWVLTMDWVKACCEANRPIHEEPYEVNLDNHGFRDSPKSGRLRVLNNGPKLFDGLSFYFNGDFLPPYKSDLLDLVRVGGGSIIESMEQLDAHRHNPQVSATSYVVYNHENPQALVAKENGSDVLKRYADADVVAKDINACVIPHTWILESIAACKVLPCPLS